MLFNMLLLSNIICKLQIKPKIMSKTKIELRIKLHDKKQELRRYKELTNVLEKKLAASNRWEGDYLRITKDFNSYKNKAQDKIQELLQRLKKYEPEKTE